MSDLRKQTESSSTRDDFRRFFLRGVAAVLPTLLTIAIIVWAYRFINDYVGVYITRGMVAICSTISPEPDPAWVDFEKDPLKYGRPIDVWDERGQRLTEEYMYIHHNALRNTNEEILAAAERQRSAALWRIAATKYKLHLLGFAIGIILVYFIGRFLASFIGRVSWRLGERLLNRIPVIRAIYPSVKQVTDFLFSEADFGFSGVVAVEYPRKGVWSIGLTTGSPMVQVQRRCDKSLQTVFIPSSPTPITGYVVQVPREDVIELNLSVDEAFRFTISGGVIKPGEKLPEKTETGG